MAVTRAAGLMALGAASVLVAEAAAYIVALRALARRVLS